MAEIVWTELSLMDLQEIHAYISNDSVKYADRVLQKIYDRVEILNSFTHTGRVVQEFEDENIRELIEVPYRIVYFLNTTELISILRVYHSARLLTADVL